MEVIPIQQLKFRLIGASTEDPENPAFSLISSNPGQGWNSVRFCSFPQEILIEFPQPIRLRQINLLFHQTKIPSKVDIYHFFPKNYNDFFSDYNTLVFDKIGFIVPDNNLKTDYKAREFKKVFLNVNCLYLKLVFFKNYPNMYNPFNQVGLVSLDCFGYNFSISNIDFLYPERDRNMTYFSNNLDQFVPQPQINDNELDEICVQKIEEIKTQLDNAVKEENYDHAKVLNQLIQRIKIIGMKIRNLTEIKLKSIELSDYDNAKVMKVEIDRLRAIVAGINNDNYLFGNSQYVNVQEQGGEGEQENMEPMEGNGQFNTHDNLNEMVEDTQEGRQNYPQQMEQEYVPPTPNKPMTKSEEIMQRQMEKRRLIEESKTKAKNNLMNERQEIKTDIRPMTNMKKYENAGVDDQP